MLFLNFTAYLRIQLDEKHVFCFRPHHLKGSLKLILFRMRVSSFFYGIALAVALCAFISAEFASAEAGPEMVLDLMVVQSGYSFCLPMSGISLSIDWGDGTTTNTTTTVACGGTTGVYHAFSATGNYTIRLYPWQSGPWLTRFGPGTSGTTIWTQQESIAFLIRVQSFGQLGTTDLRYALSSVKYLEEVPTALPSTVTQLSYLFYNSPRINSANITSWSFPLVTDLTGVFQKATKFNQPVGSWSVNQVTNMDYLFSESAFNQSLSSWNTSSVQSMRYLFNGLTTFNQNLSTWDVSKVTDLSNTFAGCTTFNGDVTTWNTAAVTSLSNTFYTCRVFNQPIGSWNTSKVTNLYYALALANVFNQPIDSWDTSKVTSIAYMLAQANAFNKPLNSWNKMKPTSLEGVFAGNYVFNQPLDAWDVSQATSAYFTFGNAGAFNQSLATWNMGNMRTTSYMFYGAYAFDNPVGMWNVSRVTDFSLMFYSAGSFNRPLGNWNTGSATNMDVRPFPKPPSTH
jgi:surface protein